MTDLKDIYNSIEPGGLDCFFPHRKEVLGMCVFWDDMWLLLAFPDGL